MQIIGKYCSIRTPLSCELLLTIEGLGYPCHVALGYPCHVALGHTCHVALGHPCHVAL